MAKVIQPPKFTCQVGSSHVVQLQHSVTELTAACSTDHHANEPAHVGAHHIIPNRHSVAAHCRLPNAGDGAPTVQCPLVGPGQGRKLSRSCTTWCEPYHSLPDSALCHTPGSTSCSAPACQAAGLCIMPHAWQHVLPHQPWAGGGTVAVDRQFWPAVAALVTTWMVMMSTSLASLQPHTAVLCCAMLCCAVLCCDEPACWLPHGVLPARLTCAARASGWPLSCLAPPHSLVGRGATPAAADGPTGCLIAAAVAAKTGCEPARRIQQWFPY